MPLVQQSGDLVCYLVLRDSSVFCDSFGTRTLHRGVWQCYNEALPERMLDGSCNLVILHLYFPLKK
jgi:hypothetical protein